MSPARRHRLYHRLQIAAHGLEKAADRALQAAGGITAAQAGVLTVVRNAGVASQRKVAQELDVNESAVTSMVGRLLKMKLLARERSDEDPRAWSLRLTTGGERTLNAVRTPFRSVNAVIESVLAEDEIALLADCLERLRNAFVDAA